MNGVQILSEGTTYGGAIGIGIFLCIIFFIIAIGAVDCIIGKETPLAIFSTVLAVFCLFGAIVCFMQKPYIEYKVTISAEVNFIEFNQKYKVVSQEGQIFTIIERQEENTNE